jgi:hypothetical protein
MASPQKVSLLSILAGASDSNVITRDDFGRSKALSIACLAGALTGVCTVQINSERDGSGTWATLQSPPGTDVAIAAGKAIMILSVPFGALRIHSAGTELAQRDFSVWGDVGEY